MKGLGVHTLPQCVYESADDFSVRENTRGKPKESRALERSGEGLAPARSLRFPKWTKPLRRKRLSPDSIRAPSPAALNPHSGLGLFSFGPRRSEKRPESLLHDGAALLLPPPTHHVASLSPSLCGRTWTMGVDFLHVDFSGSPCGLELVLRAD